jgi:indolepyruvate ferredoxin oxidoreductase
VGANLFLVGFAWQRGLAPLSLAAIERAIELNGAAVAMNLAAFAWGRRAAVDLAAVEAAGAGSKPPHHRLSGSLDERISRRAAFLTAYQGAAYAARYAEVLDSVRTAERAAAPGQEGLTSAVAQALFRLMAYKDEYEVARLHTDTRFVASIHDRFSGPVRLTHHLAPPLLARRDPVTGSPRKARFGPWIRPLLHMLARARALRGTPFDPFGHTRERRMERQLIADYRRLVLDELIPGLTAENHAAAVAVAEAALSIKGFGHLKQRSVQAALGRQAEALSRFRAAGSRQVA